MDTIEALEFYQSLTDKRIDQSNDVYMVLKDHFNFSRVECIETGASQNFDDGCFGLYLAKIAENMNGIYHSVDINKDIVDKSRLIFSEYLPNFEVQHHVSDSVKFLEDYQGSPNLVHLDSFDLDLTNPIPSMLHGWLEFVAIKDKMPSGSIILIDDNFLKDTWVDWMEIVDGQYTGGSKRIDITYDIIGKGSLIYHWCKRHDSDWILVGDHYQAGRKIKIIIKKK